MVYYLYLPHFSNQAMFPPNQLVYCLKAASEPSSPATDTDIDPDYDYQLDKYRSKKSVLTRNIPKKGKT